jgi:hypothetical protein
MATINNEFRTFSLQIEESTYLKLKTDALMQKRFACDIVRELLEQKYGEQNDGNQNAQPAN